MQQGHDINSNGHLQMLCSLNLDRNLGKANITFFKPDYQPRIVTYQLTKLC